METHICMFLWKFECKMNNCPLLRCVLSWWISKKFPEKSWIEWCPEFQVCCKLFIILKFLNVLMLFLYHFDSDMTFCFFLILLFSLKKLTSLSEWSNPMFGAFEVVGWICWTVCNMNQLCNPPSGFHGNLFNIFFANFKLNMNDSNPFVEGVWPDVRFFLKILLQKSALFMAWILLGWHQNNAFNCIQTSN